MTARVAADGQREQLACLVARGAVGGEVQGSGLGLWRGVGVCNGGKSPSLLIFGHSGHHYPGGFFPQKFQPGLDLVPSAGLLRDVFGGLKREREKSSP